MQTDLNELVERITQASGADPEINKAIASFLGMCLHPRKTYSGCQDDTGYDCDDCGADSWGNRSKDGFNRRLYDPVPAYTASIDAVRTLIDPADEIEITTLYGVARATVGLNRDHQTAWPGYGEHLGGDWCLALLIAALRARMEAERG